MNTLPSSALKVLGFFTGKITESFTLREVSRQLHMHVAQTHRAATLLKARGLLQQDKHLRLQLNFRQDHEILVFAESLRRDTLLEKGKYLDIKLFAEDIIQNIKEDAFVLLLFGSVVDTRKPRDIDVLLIIDLVDKIQFHEALLQRLASRYGLPFEGHVVSFASVSEMLAKRDQKNLMHEVLNKHIILYGGGLFYRLLERGRR